MPWAESTGRFDDGQTETLLKEMNRLQVTDPRRERLRERIVALHNPLVRSVARRYANRGNRRTICSRSPIWALSKPSTVSIPLSGTGSSPTPTRWSPAR